MSGLKLLSPHLEGTSYTRHNVATPFQAKGEIGFELREPAADAGMALVETLAEADVLCMPAEWRAYGNGQRRQLAALVEQAARAGKQVGLWVFGDVEVAFGWPNVVQFQHAFARSRPSPTTRRVLPVMMGDFVVDTFGDDYRLLPKGTRPLVGFCGQADARRSEEAKRTVLKARARLDRLIRHSQFVPEPWTSHVRLRKRVLDRLDRDPRVETDFIIRDRYRAGTHRSDPSDFRSQTKLDYYGNIHDTQYTVCVRGGGNFSVRLYETLCAGRVPLVVDADGMLPWPDDPFWSEVALVVPAADGDIMVPRLVAHHAAADDEQWTERQQRARSFWFERMSRRGYLAHMHELFDTAAPGG